MESYSVNTIETDFRAEIAAEGFAAQGWDKDNILMIRNRGHRRDVSKDIDEINAKDEYDDFGDEKTTYLRIFTNRTGMYDALPEGVFHKPASARKQRDKEDIIHEITKQRQEEVFARKYFQPFEMALDKALAEAQFYEQQYNKAHLYDNLSSIFREQWEILPYLTLRQALLFIRLIPVTGDAALSFDLTAKVMAVILECPVSIREGKKTTQRLDSQKSVTLGKWKLGIRSVLGKAVASDSRSLEITVGEIPPEQMRLFETGANSDLILKCLMDLMLPFDRDTTVKYRVTESRKKFKLSAGGHKTYLGINTTI